MINLTELVEEYNEEISTMSLLQNNYESGRYFLLIIILLWHN